MNEELRPCPFCGGKGQKVVGKGSLVYIKCGCGCELYEHITLIGDYSEEAWEESFEEAKAEVIKRWNVRTKND